MTDIPLGKSAAAGDPLENAARDLRRRLYANEFGCLTSFLYGIASQCGAQEAGVLSFQGGRIALKRSSRENTSFETYGDVIAREIARHPTPGEVFDKHSRCIPLKDDGYLILRRIWPANSWLDRPGEEVWLYILDPRPIIAGPKMSLSEEQRANLGALASAFIRWKNEIVAQRDELIAGYADNADDLVYEFRKIVIRPIRPKDFYTLVTNFRSNKLDPTRWVAYLNEFRSACQRPEAKDGCRCHLADDGTIPMSAPFKCPQTDNHDRVIDTLAKLMYWRSGFWRHAERGKFLSDALDGLDAAADLLLDPPAEFDRRIDFREGFVGPAGERALVRYFCGRAIQLALAKHRDEWEKATVHPTELEFPAKLADLAALLIGDGRWTSDAITNLLEVVALFGHRVLGVPPRIDLIRHLNETLRGESALHTLKARYRDHFFHTLEVCFLGFALLESRPDKSKPDETFGTHILKECQARGGGPAVPTDADEFLAQWWTAALVHDTAYGIDILHGTLKLLEFFTGHPEIGRLIETSRKGVAEIATKLAEVAGELKDDGSLKKGDHGLIAAASLKTIVCGIGEKTAARFEAAIRAIAFHNTRRPKVNAGKDPVAALLILCDSVQEWGRSTLRFERSPAVMLSRMMEAASTPAGEQLGPVRRYGLSLDPVAGGAYAWTDPAALRIELDYGEEILSACRAKFTWADLTYNLQRVDFRPWGKNLTVQVSVPMPGKADGKTQFAYFGEFIAAQQVRIVEDWFRTAGRGDPALAVCHRIARRVSAAGRYEWEAATLRDEGAREVVSLNLGPLGEAFADEKALMGGHIGDFDASIRVWSEYVKEQEPNPPAQHPPR